MTCREKEICVWAFGYPSRDVIIFFCKLIANHWPRIRDSDDSLNKYYNKDRH